MQHRSVSKTKGIKMDKLSVRMGTSHFYFNVSCVICERLMETGGGEAKLYIGEELIGHICRRCLEEGPKVAELRVIERSKRLLILSEDIGAIEKWGTVEEMDKLEIEADNQARKWEEQHD